MLGAVHTAAGVGVPGATVRITETSSGKAWVTWTDEDGKFKFPALPAGHFHAEISELGFAPTTPAVDVKMDVGTLAAITAPPAAESAAKIAPLTPSSNPNPTPASNENAKAGPAGAAPTSGTGTPAPSNQSANAG